MENAAELAAPPASGLTDSERELLARARDLADNVLLPRAESVDQGKQSLRENLDALADAGLVAITTPREFGGVGASQAFMRAFTETLTAACGTTWFTITQHLGACGTIAGSKNPRLREQYLSEMAAGRHLVGVGFGHLRRPQAMLRAEPSGSGWILNGVAPWVTGWPYLAGVIFGATLPDERHLYVYASTREENGLTSSPPLPLCAMNASVTTEVHLENYRIGEDAWVRESSREEMARGDERGIAGAIYPPLGCAGGSLRLLEQTAEKRASLPFIAEAAQALAREIVRCRETGTQIADGPKDTPSYKADALNARAWAIELGVRAAHLTVAASSGAANSLEHPAQRRFREAMFYTLTAQTSDIMAATLARLEREDTLLAK